MELEIVIRWKAGRERRGGRKGNVRTQHNNNNPGTRRVGMKGGKKGSLAYHEAFASNLLYIFLNIFYTDIPIHVPVFQVT